MNTKLISIQTTGWEYTRNKDSDKMAAQKIDQLNELQCELLEAKELEKTLEVAFDRALIAYKREAENVTRMVDQTLMSKDLDPQTHTIERVNGTLQIAEKTSGIEPVGSLRPDIEKISEWESERGRSARL